ncbi:MAG: hypothetical protein NT062_24265 [Proteobacteria bacterium]|nr:hypothetical protein [Pseudomonadota bacterium]
MRKRSLPHPLDHHPSYRAVLAAAPPVAALATQLAHEPSALPPEHGGLVETLAAACGDLATGFAAPPGSRRRVEAHHRAWIAVRALDRVVARVRARDPKRREVVARARRAIDRADVLIGALPGVVPG